MRTVAGRVGVAPRIAEAIAADLRQQILTSDETDVPLPRQDDLVQRYGVSGPSVREALRILEAEGLITVRRGKFGGAYVHKPDWSSAAFAVGMALQGQGATISDLAEALLELEPMCAMACAARTDRRETVVPALQRNLDEATACRDDGEAYSARAREFHELLVDGVANLSMRITVRALTSVWSIQERTWAESVKAVAAYPAPNAIDESIRTHTVLVEHIAAGNVDAVRQLSEKHLRATQRFVLERYGDQVVDSSSLLAIQAFKTL